MRRLKNVERGKSANDRGDYSKEKVEQLKIVGVRRGTRLKGDLATENEIVIQDAVLRLGHPQCETHLAHLLLEDMNGVGPVPVSTVDTTIIVPHKHQHLCAMFSVVHTFVTNQ
jgi:hypothetical protein